MVRERASLRFSSRTSGEKENYLRTKGYKKEREGKQKKKKKKKEAEQPKKMSFDQPLPPFNASDPTATFLSTSCLDFLMIELVPMTYRVANELDASSYLSNSASASSPSPTASASSPSPPPADAPNGGDALARRSNGGGETATAAAGGARRLDEDEERDAVFFRLEGLGYRVGLGLVER